MVDTGASYGSMARYTNLERMIAVNQHTLLAYGGELSDFQYVQGILRQQTISDSLELDDIEQYPEEIHEYLCRIMHNYRNKADPLYNQYVTAGFSRDNKPFLGYVDLYGTNYVDDIVVTGFGMHMALPLLRKTWRPDMTKEQATKILCDAMRVLVYRHCRTINKFRIGTFERGGKPEISEPFELDTMWEYKRFVNPRHQDVEQKNMTTIHPSSTVMGEEEVSTTN